MAGHSKWANIKHRKAAQDARRGKIFTKIIRELTVAARAGAPTVEDNPRLRAAVDKALTVNMKKDTIDKAIARGAGGLDSEQYEELTYEGYGPGGVAIYVEAMTDNRNRTAAEVRHAFTKSGGNLGTDGSVAYLFEKKGLILLPPGQDEDSVMLLALDAGADEVEASEEDGSIEIQCAPEAFDGLRAALTDAGFEPESAEVTFVAGTLVEPDEETAEKVSRIIEMLEDLDDVQNVYSNADLPA